jgi:hypothetical protein
MGHSAFWARPGAALLRIADEARAAADAIRASADREPLAFLCTDSADVEAMLARMLPGVVTRPKRFRPSGEGELHQGPGADDGLVDALVEMLLLGEVDRLVRYPPGSYFSFWGSVMSGRDARR